MRAKFITALMLGIALLGFVPQASRADLGRHPLRIVRNLEKTSKFFFWSSSHTVKLVLLIVDEDQDGKYDSYNWLEDGKTIHKGKFFSYMNSELLETTYRNEAKNNISAYINKDLDEIDIRVPSYKRNTTLGSFIIDADFENTMEFLTVSGSIVEENEIARSQPKNNIKPIQVVHLIKKFDAKSIEQIETHHIVINDVNNDGSYDFYFYIINGVLYKTGTFRSSIDSKLIRERFLNEMTQEGNGIIEFSRTGQRIPLASKTDGKSFGYLEISAFSNNEMTYSECPDFSDPYLSISEKFGLSLYPNPATDYITILTGGLLNMQATIDLYQNNIFIRNYFTGIICEDRMRFDVSNLRSGAYQFLITANYNIAFPMNFIISK